MHDIPETEMTWTNSRYALELVGVMAAYTVALIVSLPLLERFSESAWRIPLALAPMLPASLVPLLVLRHLRRLDELQRQIQLEALGFAFSGTAVITFAYGFLELAGLPDAPAFAVWPLMAALWVLGIALSSRRFR